MRRGNRLNRLLSHLSFSALLLGLLAGCATTPPAPEPAPEPPPEPVAPPPEPEPPLPASVVIATTPTDASVALGEHRPDPGETVILSAGTYELVVKRDGYLADQSEFRVPPGQELTVEVNLEPEPPTHATVRVNVTPADADISIGRHRPAAGDPISIEPGHYELEVGHEDFFSHGEQFELAAGDRRSFEITLEPIPTAVSMHVQAHHPDAKILLDDTEVGQGEASLDEVEFGAYRLTSRRQLDSWRREQAELDIQFERDGEDRFILDSAEEQWQWQDEWMAASRARDLEQQAYSRVRVADPVRVSAQVSTDTLNRILVLEAPEDWLFDQLRPGDSMDLSTDSDRWLLWRRSDQPGPAFLETVAAMQSGESYEPPWSASGDEQRSLTADIERPADLAFALTTARGQSPLVNLPAEALSALPGDLLSFHQARDDGPVLLLADNGAALQLGEVLLDPDPFGNIHVLLPPGSLQQTLRWESPPERLMVLPDSGPTLAGPEQIELRTGEKRLATIAMDQRPDRVMQFTFGPDTERTGVWEEFSAAAGPGQALDLRQLDLGPNRSDGHYQRIWILVYDSPAGRTQRQVSARYYIGVERLETEGEVFLRRQPREERDGG